MVNGQGDIYKLHVPHVYMEMMIVPNWGWWWLSIHRLAQTQMFGIQVGIIVLEYG